ncbi:MAG: zinc-ribbon domain-containing protein, partial [Planctomycetes bacterium]|nr:zinc-ribbon domain-containing protein [Planctomycetota bacterium]
MPGIVIPCPHCGKELRLRDRSKLGRKGKCPSCQQSFLLQEPEEVELELVEAPSPAVGKGAMWIPDSAAGPAASPDPGALPGAAAQDFAGFDFQDDAAAAPSPLKELRTRRGRRSKTGIIVGGAVGSLLAVAVLVFVFTRGREEPKPEPKKRVASVEYKAAKEELRDNFNLAAAASPTHGKPIELLHVPSGANIIFHIRPAELWSEEPQAQELMACLGDVGQWAQAKLAELCRFEPKEIEEALICLILPVRGEPPDVAVVV